MRETCIFVMNDGASETKFLAGIVIDAMCGVLVRMEGTKYWILLGFDVGFEMNMGSVHFGSGRVGRLNGDRFAPRLGLVLLLVVFEIGSEGRIGLPYLQPVHLTNYYIQPYNQTLPQPASRPALLIQK